ncbi:MAG: lipopolysaccharide heptosyltransferase family protein [Ignavibacteria bacterium]|nr:lipopolysaccharide heptosyltransferase family protein [Ignavibacteria bacterium]
MNFNNLKVPKCKNYSGYKPCEPYYNCLEEGCKNSPEKDMGVKILIISLDALGNVLDNTPILPEIKRKYPVSTVYWMTLPNAKNILFNNRYIDKLFLWSDESRMIARNIEYDIVMNADKSDYACAFANEVKAKKKLGFLLNEEGKIIPANESAMYSYILGIDDRKKFRENTKTGVEIIHDVFELEYKRDRYVFELTEDELEYAESYKKSINYNPEKIYAGFNTGCSELFPNKKMTFEQHIYLITEILKNGNTEIMLLGGREDTERNDKIYNAFSKEQRRRIINSPTTEGIRRGACYMSVPDIVISGDSFGMHLAIALQKYIIAWFGLSCHQEIELYDYGIKLYPKNLECSPCWKRQCPYNLECIDAIDLDRIVNEVNRFKKRKTENRK